MAKKNEPVRPKHDALASEIDALLKKLPGADPDLLGSDAAPSRQAPGSVPRSGGRPPRPQARSAAGQSGSDTRTALAVWGRVSLGVLLGVGLAQWPYRDDCGWPLLWYGLAVGVMLIVAGWCAVTTWRYRAALAHVVSLVMGFWGIVLAGELLLPRIGYASQEATWRCPAPAATTAPPRAPPPPAIQSPATTSEGTAQPDEPPEAGAGDRTSPPDSTDR